MGIPAELHAVRDMQNLYRSELLATLHVSEPRKRSWRANKAADGLGQISRRDQVDQDWSLL